MIIRPGHQHQIRRHTLLQKDADPNSSSSYSIFLMQDVISSNLLHPLVKQQETGNNIVKQDMQYRDMHGRVTLHSSLKTSISIQIMGIVSFHFCNFDIMLQF